MRNKQRQGGGPKSQVIAATSPAERPQIEVASARVQSPPAGLWLFTASLLVLFAAAFVVAFWVKVIDADLFWHLRTGELIWDTQSVPRVDPFSATARGHEWIAQEWLWEALMFQVFSRGGWVALSVVRCAMIGAALVIGIITARVRGASWFSGIASAGIMMCALMAIPDIRPQNVTFMFFSFTILVLELARVRPWLLLLLPMLGVLWANMHAAYLIMFVLAGVTGFGWLIEASLDSRSVHLEGIRNISAGWLTRMRCVPLTRSIVWLFASCVEVLLASLINPRGYKLLTFPLRVVGESALRSGITEWSPPDLHVWFWPFYGAAAVALVLFVWRRKSLRPTDWAVFVTFAAASFSARRQIAFLSLAVIPPLAVCIESALSLARSQSAVSRAVWRAALVVLFPVIFSLSYRLYGTSRPPFGVGPAPDRFPEKPATILDALSTGGVVLNDYDDGGYLIWRNWPKWNVTMDGRADIYGPRILQEFGRIWYGPTRDMQQELDRWNVDAIVGRYDDSRSARRSIYRFLADSPQWVLVYWDDTHMLYLRAGRVAESSEHKPYRRVHPALPWSELAAMQKTQPDWENLGADIRRALSENPGSRRAAAFQARLSSKK